MRWNSCSLCVALPGEVLSSDWLLSHHPAFRSLHDLCFDTHSQDTENGSRAPRKSHTNVVVLSEATPVRRRRTRSRSTEIAAILRLSSRYTQPASDRSNGQGGQGGMVQSMNILRKQRG